MFCHRMLWSFKSEMATVRSKAAHAMKVQAAAEEEAEAELMHCLVSRKGKIRGTTSNA